MKIHVAKTAEELGAQAAHTIAEKLCEAIAESGEAGLYCLQAVLSLKR